VVGRRGYDLMYRFGAPWEGGPRQELVELVASGRLSPEAFKRAIDLGCGSGANAIFLAEHGFDVTGVDFSPVALRKAQAKAVQRGVPLRLLRGDLTRLPTGWDEEPFDLLVDYGTLDDLKGSRRRGMAKSVVRLSLPGSVFLLWCFYARLSELPLISFRGASRLAPPIEPGEEDALFGHFFDIERLPRPEPESGAACFLMTRG
jgi:SAM-dependent methyltransferase